MTTEVGLFGGRFLAIAAAWVFVGTARAGIVDQDVMTSFGVRDAQGHVSIVTQDADHSQAFTPAESLSPVSAFIGGSGHSATAKANANAAYGLVADQFQTGLLTTTYQFGGVGDFTNNASFPVNVTSNFLITHGRLAMSAAAGSTIKYDLEVTTLSSAIHVFESHGILTATDYSHLTFQTSGQDIGATLVAPAHGQTRVEIPLSQQQIDFGTLQPGEDLVMSYEMTISSDLDAPEFAHWEFQDPLHLDTSGTAPVTFKASPAVPERAILPMLLAGFGALAALGWARRRPAVVVTGG